jgi:DNA-binding transcriptional ArsR family regulator
MGHFCNFEYSFTGIFKVCYIYGKQMVWKEKYRMNIETFTALAEPHRLEIIDLLLGGPLPVGEIAERLELNQPQASKHLKVLSDAGFVEVQPIANKRIYKLNAAPFQEMDDWLRSFRRMWEERLDRLDEYLNQLQAKENNGSKSIE